jgi:GNAT superfamily N-acetyltransferase
MSFTWHKDVPVWDANKERIVGNVEPGILDSRYSGVAEGAPVPCMWYRAENEKGETVGYGWVDVVWGDAEILLAIDKDYRGKGAGAFILDGLDKEARRMGLNYIYNVVRPSHPRGEEVTKWLTKQGFKEQSDGRHKKGTSPHEEHCPQETIRSLR